MAKKGGNPQNLKPFKKGQSGNPNGRPKLPDITEALEDEVGDKGIREVLKALYKKAKAGDVRAIQELLDRSYGKSNQTIDHKNNGESFEPTQVVFGKGQTNG
jgi:hypothetical protein